MPFAPHITDYHFTGIGTLSNNVLWAFGRRHSYFVELDYEAKIGDKSLFSEIPNIYEAHRE